MKSLQLRETKLLCACLRRQYLSVWGENVRRVARQRQTIHESSFLLLFCNLPTQSSESEHMPSGCSRSRRVQ